MIKQIPSKEIKDYIKDNPKCVLLDVRTEEEWTSDGKPDAEKIGLKTYFLGGEKRVFYSRQNAARYGRKMSLKFSKSSLKGFISESI